MSYYPFVHLCTTYKMCYIYFFCGFIWSTIPQIYQCCLSSESAGKSILVLTTKTARSGKPVPGNQMRNTENCTNLSLLMFSLSLFTLVCLTSVWSSAPRLVKLLLARVSVTPCCDGANICQPIMRHLGLWFHPFKCPLNAASYGMLDWREGLMAQVFTR